MALDPITAGFDLLKTAADKLWPDPAVRTEQLLRLEQLHQDGKMQELQIATSVLLAQVDLNKTEAQHPSVFVAGWRPAIGWVCALSLFVYYVPYCLAAVGMWVYECVIADTLLPRPDLNVADLVGLVSAMLGVSVPRTLEKINGVATTQTTGK